MSVEGGRERGREMEERGFGDGTVKDDGTSGGELGRKGTW